MSLLCFLLSLIIPFQEIQPSISPADSVLIMGDNTIISYTIDLKNERLFFFHNVNNRLYEVSYTGETSSFQVDFKENMAGQNLHYNEEKNALLFWDDGGGRVHLLNMDDRTLERVDRSFNFRSFLMHGAWVNDQMDIYIMGGYGLFELKNLLLKYSSELREWIMVPVTGDIPDRGYGRFYYMDTDSSLLYFLFEPDRRSRLSTGTTVFKINTNSFQWEKIGFFNLDLASTSRVENRVGNKRVDPIRGYIHLTDNVLFDIKKNHIVFVDLSIISTELQVVYSMFYTGVQDEWIVVGRTKGQDLQLFIQKVNLSELLTNSVSVRMESWVTHPLGQIGIVVSLCIVIFAGIWKIRRTGNQKDKRNHSDSAISVSIHDSEIILEIQGKRSQIKDPIERNLWKFVIVNLSKGLNSFDITEFDQEVLGSISHPSQRSKKRASLLENINRLVGEELFVVNQSLVDKRYKQIVIRENKIRINKETNP